jgi:hypothetical protein
VSGSRWDDVSLPPLVHSTRCSEVPLGSSLLGSARHASIAVDRIRIAEVSYWRTPISPGTILDLRQIANALIEADYYPKVGFSLLKGPHREMYAPLERTCPV